jgi:hypothetical protein
MSQYIESLKKKAKEYEAERADLAAKVAKYNARLLDLNGAIAGIDTLLRVEGGSAETPASSQVPPSPPSPAATSNGKGATTLYEVLHEVLADGKPRDEQELISLAKNRGVDFGEKEPRRTVAFTLMGIARGKKIKRLKDNIWQRVS